jgi:hypothetical protein
MHENTKQRPGGCRHADRYLAHQMSLPGVTLSHTARRASDARFTLVGRDDPHRVPVRLRLRVGYEANRNASTVRFAGAVDPGSSDTSAVDQLIGSADRARRDLARRR